MDTSTSTSTSLMGKDFVYSDSAESAKPDYLAKKWDKLYPGWRSSGHQVRARAQAQAQAPYHSGRSSEHQDSERPLYRPLQRSI